MDDAAETQETQTSKTDNIQIYEVDNPQFVSLHKGFIDMTKRFVDTSLKNIPSITYESFSNYIASVVEGICQKRLAGVPEAMIQTRLQVGYVGNDIKGFQVFYMMTNRLPHVMTMSWTYIYSEDTRLTNLFAREITKYQKKWNAKYIACTLANPRLSKVADRLFKKRSIGGEYQIVSGVRHEYINIS